MHHVGVVWDPKRKVFVPFGRSEPRLGPPRNHQLVVANELRDQGWDLYSHGWPDFLALRDGEVRLIEAKSPTDRLNKYQKVMFPLIAMHLGVEVEVLRAPDIPWETPEQTSVSEPHSGRSGP